MIILPPKIKINGHIFKVIFPYRFIERSDIFGQVDTGTNEIRISDVDGGGQIRCAEAILETLIHEIIHGIDMLQGNHIFHSDGREDYKIEGLAQGWYQVLIDNPEFTKLFIKG